MIRLLVLIAANCWLQAQAWGKPGDVLIELTNPTMYEVFDVQGTVLYENDQKDTRWLPVEISGHTTQFVDFPAQLQLRELNPEMVVIECT